MEMAKRVGPKAVNPVVHKGIRYEAPPWDREQRGGYVVAFDARSGKEIWAVRVYTTVYDEREEQDVQDVFITRLALHHGPDRLEVRDEQRRTFFLDLTTREVTQP